jgi:hypothetical protein
MKFHRSGKHVGCTQNTTHMFNPQFDFARCRLMFGAQNSSDRDNHFGELLVDNCIRLRPMSVATTVRIKRDLLNTIQDRWMVAVFIENWVKIVQRACTLGDQLNDYPMRILCQSPMNARQDGALRQIRDLHRREAVLHYGQPHSFQRRLFPGSTCLCTVGLPFFSPSHRSKRSRRIPHCCAISI